MADRIENRETNAANEQDKPQASPFDYSATRSILPGNEQTNRKTGEPQSLDFATAPDIYRTGPKEKAAASPEQQVDGRETGGKKANSDSAGNFVPEKLDNHLQKRMKDFNIPQETSEKALREINKYGEDPAVTAKSLMASNRVLAMGETHQSPNPQRDLGTQILPELKKAGATHLAIEAPMRIQPALDEYMKSGKLDPKELPPLLRDQDYLNLLESARKSGIKIVAVDADGKYVEASDLARMDSKGFEDRQQDNAPHVNRDQTMAANVSSILKEDPHNKVVFWVGSGHLNHFENLNYKTASDLLKHEFATATVKPIYPNERNQGYYPLSELTANLNRAVAISTQKAATVGDLPVSKYDTLFKQREREWDYIFAFPGHQ